MLKSVYMGGKPLLKYSAAKTNVVFDGNSIVAGANASSSAFYINALVRLLAPINSQFTCPNLGVGGQTINNMRGLSEVNMGAPNPGGGDTPSSSTADIDNSWVSGKTNVMVLWEATNSIYGAGWTGLQAAAQMASLISERQATHPWKYLIVTTLPRWAEPYGRTNVQANNELRAFDAYVKANYKAMGAHAVADVRAGASAFNIPTTSLTDFETPELWGTNGVGGMWSLLDNTNNADTTKHTHLQDAGFQYIARYIAAALGRIPA